MIIFGRLGCRFRPPGGSFWRYLGVLIRLGMVLGAVDASGGGGPSLIGALGSLLNTILAPKTLSRRSLKPRKNDYKNDFKNKRVLERS